MSPEQENSPQKYRVQYVRFKDTQDDLAPPPPNLVSKFETLEDWLFAICNLDKPRKSVAKFKFALFESANDYTIVLTGVNAYEEGKGHSATRIEFEPNNMYFKLPESYYVNLGRQQLLNKLTVQFREFSCTEKFRNSFLTEADTIVFETNGQTIWSRK